MSQIGRTLKNLEAPRPLKSSMSRLSNTHHAPAYELQTIEELITLIENVADSVSMGQCNPDSMSMLLANLRIHGPQLEDYSKSTLDQAYVKFRNASQDERLSIITRMNLLELIELRAKSWQISDGINTYYKHKASDVQPETIPSAAMNDITLLGTSPPAGTTLAPNLLSPGELIRTSGKFTKPTKIPGKNYTKDEVVIRNADSGKVMGIKGRRVHMIEELSETIISFQRVSPGAKERLVQITGPNEEKINCAKQLIEDTIRRNASPVRMDETGQGVVGAGSCSSLNSSNSDEALPRANRNSILLPAGATGAVGGQSMAQAPYTVPNQSNQFTGIHGGGHKSRISTAGTGNPILLHSLSTNDASLGEYKYTVNVGHNSLKITGDCFDLVRVAKLVLDEYFGSSEFQSYVDAADSVLLHSASTASMPGSSLPTPTSQIPSSHQLSSASPFVDSGIGLNVMASSQFGGQFNNQCSIDNDDDVFFIEDDDTLTPVSSIKSAAAAAMPSAPQPNGLTRSRRSHFSHSDANPDTNKEAATKSNIRVTYENERLVHFSKSPHSWSLPRDWLKICELYPTIVRNKNLDDEKNRFDAYKYLQFVRSEPMKLTVASTGHDDNKSETPSDTE